MHLDEFAAAADLLERASRGADLAAPVPGCNPWTVADLVRHTGSVHRMVLGWTTTGRRPAASPPAVPGGDPRDWYAEGWRALHEHLAGLDPRTPVPTWHPVDDTAGFWRRRMAHETVVHALDACRAAGCEDAWQVGADLAADGVDEVLRTFLATRLGPAGGSGELVQVRVPGRWWAVALHRHVVEVGEPAGGPFEALLPDAVVRAPAAEAYRWLWGRGGDVDVSGDRAAVDRLRGALARATA